MRNVVKVVTRIRKQLCHPIGDFLFRTLSILISSVGKPTKCVAANKARTSHLAVKSFEPLHVLD